MGGVMLRHLLEALITLNQQYKLYRPSFHDNKRKLVIQSIKLVTKTVLVTCSMF